LSQSEFLPGWEKCPGLAETMVKASFFKELDRFFTFLKNYAKVAADCSEAIAAFIYEFFTLTSKGRTVNEVTHCGLQANSNFVF
jgi:hypothetical protein